MLRKGIDPLLGTRASTAETASYCSNSDKEIRSLSVVKFLDRSIKTLYLVILN